MLSVTGHIFNQKYLATYSWVAPQIKTFLKYFFRSPPIHKLITHTKYFLHRQCANFKLTRNSDRAHSKNRPKIYILCILKQSVIKLKPDALDILEGLNGKLIFRAETEVSAFKKGHEA